MNRPLSISAMVATALTFFVFLAASNVVRAVEIKVLAGSALDPVMNDLILQFEKSSGYKVNLDSDGAIGAMTSRIQKGEVADVVIVSGPQIDLLVNGHENQIHERTHRKTQGRR